MHLQRLFSTFAGGGPGVGLLVLRIVVGVTAGIEGLQLGSAGPAPAAVWIVAVLAVVSGGALTIGFLTPATGAIAGLSTLFIAMFLLPASSSVLLLDDVTVLFVLSNTVAIVLLGPGAFSVDARLFGRRQIVIPIEP